MHDTEPSNPFEAPKQPTVSSAPTLGDPIRYEATPTINDLNSALRPVFPIITTSILLSLLLFGGLAGSLSIANHGLKSGYEFLFVLSVFTLSSLLCVRIFRLVNVAKTHLRLSPAALTLRTGELNNQGLLLHCKQAFSWQPHSSLRSCQHRNNQLSLCYDPQLVIHTILPTRGFQSPPRAIQLLEFHAKQASPPMDWAQPFTGPSMIGDPPAASIQFSGILKSMDVTHSPLDKIRKRGIIRLMIRLLLVNVALLPILAASFAWPIKLLIVGGVLLYDSWVIQRIRQSVPKDPEHALMASQGWLNEQEIGLLHNLGQSRLAWHDLQATHANDSCIWLQTYGGKNRFILLPRRFFADASQWQAAVDLARRQLKQPGS